MSIFPGITPWLLINMPYINYALIKMKDKSIEHPFCWIEETDALSDIEDKTVSLIS